MSPPTNGDFGHLEGRFIPESTSNPAHVPEQSQYSYSVTACVNMSMGTDHIRISDEAKARLESRKRDDESFTDVIIRLTERDADVERFAGAYADVDLADGVERVEERMDDSFRET